MFKSAVFPNNVDCDLTSIIYAFECDVFNEDEKRLVRLSRLEKPKKL